MTTSWLIIGLILVAMFFFWTTVYWFGKTRDLKRRVSQLERQLYNTGRWQG